MRPEVTETSVPPAPTAADTTETDRRRAIAAAVAEADGVAGRALTASVGGAGGIGVRVYAPGRVVLALAGRFDRAGVDRLRALAPSLERQSVDELVIDCSRLRVCDHALARVVGRLRIRRLAAEARVELREPPEAVRREVGHRCEDDEPTDAPSDTPTDVPGQRGFGTPPDTSP